MINLVFAQSQNEHLFLVNTIKYEITVLMVQNRFKEKLKSTTIKWINISSTLQQFKKKKNSLVFIFVCFIVIVVLLFIYYTEQNYKRKRRSEKEKCLLCEPFVYEKWEQKQKLRFYFCSV